MTENTPPPLRPPFFADAIGGENCFLEPAGMLDTIASHLQVAIVHERIWAVGEWKILPSPIRPRSFGEPIHLDILVTSRHAQRKALLDVGVHPSGWIDACLAVEGFAPHHFFIERIYEEFEIWPPGSDCSATDSGRMGKRCGWIQLDVAFWPNLAFLADGRFVTVEPDQRPSVPWQPST